jgi:hypothetical protein
MLTANGIPTMVDRVQQGQPATLWTGWERAGESIDPGTVAVSVYSDRQGATILTGASTGGAPGLSRSFILTPAQTANLDRLTVTWTASDSSVLTSYVEVVGGFLFSTMLARSRSPLQEATYTSDTIMAFRTNAEMALEDICGVAFVPRYSREEMSINAPGMLVGSRRRIRSVQQITTHMSDNMGGFQQPLTTLSGMQIVNGTSIYMPSFWNWFSRPIYAAYEHGYDFPPPRVTMAALLLARRWIIESPWDERTTGFRTREGGEMNILTATHTDPFDIPEVVAVADTYGFPVIA